MPYDDLVAERLDLVKRKLEIEGELSALKLKYPFKGTKWEKYDWNKRVKLGNELSEIHTVLPTVTLLAKQKRIKAEERLTDTEIDIRNSNHLLRWAYNFIKNHDRGILSPDDQIILDALRTKLLNYFGCSQIK